MKLVSGRLTYCLLATQCDFHARKSADLEEDNQRGAICQLVIVLNLAACKARFNMHITYQLLIIAQLELEVLILKACFKAGKC